MKSSVKIDYDRSQELKPVIKIILPLDLRDGDKCTEAHNIDPRDKLVADFLHTPRNLVENYLFEVNQRWLIDNGSSLLTTISPIPEEEMFFRLKTAIMGRIIGDNIEAYRGCESFKESDKTGPCPLNYDRWLKITEFFEWVKEQPYSGESVLPDKLTIRHVFETMLSQDERIAAFENTPKYKWDSEVISPDQALDIAFDFKSSPQGVDYWNKVLSMLNTTVDK